MCCWVGVFLLLGGGGGWSKNPQIMSSRLNVFFAFVSLWLLVIVKKSDGTLIMRHIG